MGRISIHVVQAVCFVFYMKPSVIWYFPALVQQTAVVFNIEFASPWYIVI